MGEPLLPYELHIRLAHPESDRFISQQILFPSLLKTETGSCRGVVKVKSLVKDPFLLVEEKVH